MKRGILLVWVFLLVLSYANARSEQHPHEGPGSPSFPEGYLESAQGAALVLFFTGDIKGNFEPCG